LSVRHPRERGDPGSPIRCPGLWTPAFARVTQWAAGRSGNFGRNMRDNLDDGAMGCASAAVEDVIAELLHLEDRGVGAPGDWLSDMRVDDLANDDVVVTLFDDAGDPALDRGRCRIEDRCPGRALVDGLAGELAVFELGRLEEGECDPLTVLAEHVQGKGLGILYDAVSA